MFAVSGILFNHESERRGHEFVTRKISDGVAKIHLGLADSISLGNIKAQRDWGYSPDYVEAMWLMLQQEKPEDYVIATGEVNSVEDFLTIAFQEIGINDWAPYIKKDDKFFRPAEVDVLRGDWSKAKSELGWEPKTNFNELVKKMVNNDIQILKHI
jgi:GDPmannose 4,6-dehydratase